MSEPRFLVDSSVVGRSHQAVVGDRLETLLLAGKFWTCRLVDLEAVYGARARDVTDVIAQRRILPEAPITPAVMDRALQVAGMMATAGLHRGAKATDLVIAAAAEAAHLTVLHYDDDFDRISAVTGQPCEWVSPPGTLDA